MLDTEEKDYRVMINQNWKRDSECFLFYLIHSYKKHDILLFYEHINCYKKTERYSLLFSLKVKDETN